MQFMLCFAGIFTNKILTSPLITDGNSWKLKTVDFPGNASMSLNLKLERGFKYRKSKVRQRKLAKQL